NRAFPHPTPPRLLAVAALLAFAPAARPADPPAPRIEVQQFKDAIKAVGLNGQFSVTGGFTAAEGPAKVGPGEVRTTVNLLLETKEELARGRYDREADRNDPAWLSESFDVAGGGPLKGILRSQER